MDWDLTSYFDAFQSDEYNRFVQQLRDDLTGMSEDIDGLSEDAAFEVGNWTELLLKVENFLQRFSHWNSYLGCLSSADSSNAAYRAEEGQQALFQSKWSVFRKRLDAAIGALTEQQLEDLKASPKLNGAEFWLDLSRIASKNQMDAGKEGLNAELDVTGAGAWSRLYFNLTGSLSFTMDDGKGGTVSKPYSQYRSLLSQTDRGLRQRAYAGLKETLKTHELFLSTSLNSLAGSRHVLNQHRGIEHFLQPALHQSRVTKKTLDALMSALWSERSFAQEVFKTRAKIQGIQDPQYLDLYAPIPIEGSASPDWEAATQLVEGAFLDAYPALGEFFAEMKAKRWFDYSPRAAKRPGGFCTGSLLSRESRIFMTYQDTLGDVRTLAHEAGHAWHSRAMKDVRPYASSYPMTLAETASTFAEKILSDGVLSSDRFSAQDKLALVDEDTTTILAFLLDIPVRFSFEKAFYEQRKSGELSAEELCNLMAETQRTWFGDSLSEGGEDPWFWASKLHFFIHEVQFYNFPYTFGFLLSHRLFQRFKAEGASFLKDYERFLEASGSASCESIVQEYLGENIEEPAFWVEAIQGLQPTLDNLVQMTNHP